MLTCTALSITGREAAAVIETVRCNRPARAQAARKRIDERAINSYFLFLFE